MGDENADEIMDMLNGKTMLPGDTIKTEQKPCQETKRSKPKEVMKAKSVFKSFLGFLYVVALPIIIVFFTIKLIARKLWASIIALLAVTSALAIYAYKLITDKTSFTNKIFWEIPIWVVFLVGGLILLVLIFITLYNNKRTTNVVK